MSPFEWNFPTKLVYGPGRVKEVAAIAGEYGQKAILATYGEGSSQDPVVETVKSSLESAGIEVVIFRA